MHRVVRALGGGVAGTAVLSFFLLVLDTQARAALSVPAVVARFVGTPGNPPVAVVLFAVTALFVWPLLFIALEDSLPRGPDPAARGVVFAAIIWVVFVLLGRGDIAGPVLVVYVGFTLIAYLAYGFALGAVYGRLEE